MTHGSPSTGKSYPKALETDLIFRELASEVLIYNTRTDRVTAINSVAARVWRACDGENDIGIIAAKASTADEIVVADTVWKTLDLLEKAGLLAGPLNIPAEVLAGQDRRSFMRQATITALVAVPVVAGITAPTPAQAATLRADGSPCTQNEQCASNFCNPFAGCQPNPPPGA